MAAFESTDGKKWLSAPKVSIDTDSQFAYAFCVSSIELDQARAARENSSSRAIPTKVFTKY